MQTTFNTPSYDAVDYFLGVWRASFINNRAMHGVCIMGEPMVGIHGVSDNSIEIRCI